MIQLVGNELIWYKVNKCLSVESATDSESEAASGAQTIRPRFAREETEQSRKRREASSQHRQKLADQDPWIPLQFVRSAVCLQTLVI